MRAVIAIRRNLRGHQRNLSGAGCQINTLLFFLVLSNQRTVNMDYFHQHVFAPKGMRREVQCYKSGHYSDKMVGLKFFYLFPYFSNRIIPTKTTRMLTTKMTAKSTKMFVFIQSPSKISCNASTI